MSMADIFNILKPFVKFLRHRDYHYFRKQIDLKDIFVSTRFYRFQKGFWPRQIN